MAHDAQLLPDRAVARRRVGTEQRLIIASAGYRFRQRQCTGRDGGARSGAGGGGAARTATAIARLASAVRGAARCFVRRHGITGGQVELLQGKWKVIENGMRLDEF